MDPGLASADAAESAVLVPVPEAEPAVGGHRAMLDPAAGRGVPAHVTVLYPFVAPALLTPAIVAALAAAVRSVASFGCELAATRWFGERVLWLEPVPGDRFRALTAAVMAAVPGYLPYGGAYPDTVPHLTIGDQAGDGAAALRAAETDIRRHLPIRARITQAWLMTGTTAPGSWQVAAELPLAAC